MSKRSVFTSITPLPPHVARETAVALLHDHVEMITMNPLVVRMEPTDPPPNATPEEVKVMHWYAITDEIVYVPGTKVKGETTYKAGFYNLPRGLQTHVFAPAGVDMKTKWSVGGSLPGEAKESVELGLNAPREGLYIREDADLRCSVFLMNFVKRNLKKGHSVLCERLIEKASRLDEERRANPQSAFSSHVDSTPQRWDHLYTPASSRPSNASAEATPVDNTCACEGVSHEPGCESYMHPGRTKQTAAVDTMERAPSTRQDTVDLLLGQRSSWHETPTSFYPQQASRSQICSCAGAVHGQTCSQHPGLFQPHPRSRSTGPKTSLTTQHQQQPYQLNLSTGSGTAPLSAHPQTNPYSFSTPEFSPTNVPISFSGHPSRPHRPAAQAQWPAIAGARDIVDDVSTAGEHKPDPHLIRTPHGYAVVMELNADADDEDAGRYWQQRVGGDPSREMARG